MEASEAILIAFRRVLNEAVLGIEQVDAVLTEDGGHIMLMGYTADDDVTYVATFPVPVIEWRKA